MSYESKLAEAHDRLAKETNRYVDLVARDNDQREAQARASAAQRMMEEREQARADADRRREIQARYSDAFNAHGTLVPAPVDDERPGQYRQRLFNSLQRKLPPAHELATVRSDDLSSGLLRRNFENMLIEAAAAEGATPSPANLPKDGSMVTRVRIDPDSGQKRTEFYGRELFIKQLSQAPQRVARLCTKMGDVLYVP